MADEAEITLDQEQIERAEAVIAQLVSSYLLWVRADLLRLRDLWEQAEAASPADRKRIFTAMFRLTHDVKGQGGSFGYDLVSEIADRLCRYLERTDQWPDPALAVVKAHIDAIATVVEGDIQGPGDDSHRHMLLTLEERARNGA